MSKVPAGVAKDALKGLLMIKNGYEGGMDTGKKRAVQLSRSNSIDADTLRTMRNWFARHRITSYPGYLKWVDDGKPTEMISGKKAKYRGAVAWLIWGGTPAYNWINSRSIQTLLRRNFPDKENKLPPL